MVVLHLVVVVVEVIVSALFCFRHLHHSLNFQLVLAKSAPCIAIIYLENTSSCVFFCHLIQNQVPLLPFILQTVFPQVIIAGFQYESLSGFLQMGSF